MNRFTIKENLIISAGAGTGKTYTLSRRYVNILLGFDFFSEANGLENSFNKNDALAERAGPHEIVTITYTEAAAAEMKDRIMGLISVILQVIRGSETEDDSITSALTHHDNAREYVHETLSEAESQMIYARISTIHSFSLNIVRHYSDILALDLSPTVIRDDKKKLLFHDSLTSVLEENEQVAYRVLDTIGSFKLNTVAEKFINDGKFRRNMDRFIADRHSAETMYELYSRFIASTSKKNFIRSMELLCELEHYAKNPDTYWKYRHFFRDYLECILRPECGIPETVRIFSVMEEGSELREEFQEQFKNIKKLAYETDQDAEDLFRKTLADIHGLLTSVYDEYNRGLKKRNSIDFNIIINRAWELVMNGTARPGYRYFMIDEFQDTNELQWEMISALISENGANVFLVGDDKQSIYSFQGAEVAVFHKAGDDIQAEPLPMTVNFRSEERVLDFINSCFLPLFTHDDGPVSCSVSGDDFSLILDLLDELTVDIGAPIRYHPLAPRPERTGTGKGTTAFLITPTPDVESEDEYTPVELEHRNIARFIRKIRDGVFTEYRDITKRMNGDQKAVAVLFDSRRDMALLKDELLMRGITALVNAREDFYRTGEVIDLFHVLRVIVNLEEKSEWKFIKKFHLAGALRGSVFRLDEDRISEIFENSDARQVIDLMKDFITAKRHMSIGDLISFIICRSNLLTVYRHLDDYEERAANLEKLTGRAGQWEREQGSNLREFVKEMERFIFFEDSGEDTALYEAPGRNSVVLNTIHGAKGLEYPMVILPGITGNLARQQQSDSFKHAKVLADNEFNTVFGFKVLDSSHTSYRFASSVSLAQHLEEKKRLLYVALTRAEEHIVISLPPTGGTVPKECYGEYIAGQYGISGGELIELAGTVVNRAKVNKQQKIRGLGNTTAVILDDDDIPVEQPGRSVPIIELREEKLFPEEITGVAVTEKLRGEDAIYVTDEGALLGTAFHELMALSLDYLDDKGKMKKQIEAVSRKYLFENDKQEALERFADNFRKCEIYSGLIDAEERYPEYGFTFMGDDGYSSGIIDLLYRHDGTLKIVDYKTNSLRNTNPAEEIEKHKYDKQLEEYAKAVEQSTGETVAERILVFVDSGCVVRV